MANLTPEQAAQIWAYRDDPVGFDMDILGDSVTVEDVLAGRAYYATAPWEKQAEILTSVRDHQRTVVPASHNVGKTHISARVGLWFLYARYPSIVITTAPKLAQVRDLLWARWGEAWNKARYPLGGRCLTMACYPLGREAPNWFAAGYTANSAEGFSGYHEADVLLILDEGPGVPGFIWEACEGMLSGASTRFLAIGNPISRAGDFWKACGAPLYNTIHISAWEHPNVAHDRLIYQKAVAPGWPAERIQVWGEDDPRYQSRVMGVHPDEGEGQLISRAWVEACVEREVETDGPSVLGNDVARSKSPKANETVFMAFVGRMAELARHYRGNDTAVTASVGHRYLQFFSVLGVDDTGVGAGVTDGLRGKGARIVPVAAFEDDPKERVSLAGNDPIVIPFNFGARPTEAGREDFATLGAEAAWMLRSAFQEGHKAVNTGHPDQARMGISIPDDDTLKDQICSIQFDWDRYGRIYIIKPEGEDSPDRADALIIAWFMRYLALKRATGTRTGAFVSALESMMGDDSPLTAGLLDRPL